MRCGPSRPRERATLQYCQGVRRTRWWRRDERLVRYEVNAVTRAFTAKLTQTERYDLIEVPKFARREHETSSSRLLPCAPGALATNTEHRRLASLRRVASPVRCSLVQALRLSTEKIVVAIQAQAGAVPTSTSRFAASCSTIEPKACLDFG